jgi:hypothetical protein
MPTIVLFTNRSQQQVSIVDCVFKQECIQGILNIFSAIRIIVLPRPAVPVQAQLLFQEQLNIFKRRLSQRQVPDSGYYVRASIIPPNIKCERVVRSSHNKHSPRFIMQLATWTVSTILAVVSLYSPALGSPVSHHMVARFNSPATTVSSPVSKSEIPLSNEVKSTIARLA